MSAIPWRGIWTLLPFKPGAGGLKPDRLKAGLQTRDLKQPLDWKKLLSIPFDRFKAEHRRIGFLHDYR
jgi:hypothetical protein